MSTDPKPPSAADYALTFESRGLTFALGEIGILDYMPAGSMIIGQEGTHWEFMSAKETLTAMDREGVEYFSTITPIRNSAERLERLFNDMDKAIARFKTEEKITEEDLKQAYSLIARIQDEYRHFGHGYTDTVFLESKNDAAKQEALEFVAAHKNDIRVRYDKVVFTKDGALPTILHKVSKQFAMEGDDASWHLQKEILGLFKGESIDPTHLSARRKAYVFYKISPGRSHVLYEGTDARTFIEQFGGLTVPEGISEIRGKTANSGPLVRGAVRVINSNYADMQSVEKKMAQMRQGDILVATVTAPDLMPACRKAAAIITDVGGLLSHGAIIGRELGIPAIVDTQIASKILKDGDMVEVDAEKGIVRKI